MAFNAGAIEATLTLNRDPFRAGLALARKQGEDFAREKYEATASIKLDKRGLNDVIRQLRDFGRQSRQALARVTVDRKLFDKLVHDLREFGRQTYTARARVDIADSGSALNGLINNIRRTGTEADNAGRRFTAFGNSGSEAFGRVHGAARLVLTTLPLLLPVAGSAITGLIGLVGSLASILTVAGVGAAAFALVAVPAFTKVKDAVAAGQGAIDALPPGLREAANAMQGLTRSYEALQARTQTPVGFALAAGFRAAEAAIRTLDPIIIAVSNSLVAIGRDIEQYFGTAHWSNFVNFISANVGPVFASLWDIVKNLTRAVMDLVVAFMPMAQWLLAAVAQGMQQFAQWASTLANDPKFHAWVELAKEALTAFWGALVEVVKFLFNLSTALAPVGTVIFDVLRMIFEGLNKIPPEWLRAIALALGAVFAALAIGAGGPVALVVGAIVALAAGFRELYASSEPFRQAIDRIWSDIQTRFLPVLQELWNQLQTKVGPALASLASLFENTLIPAFERFYFAVAPILEWLMRVIGTEIVDTLRGAVQIVEGLLQVLAGAFDVVAGVLTGNWSLAWQGLKNIVEGALNIILSLFGVKMSDIVNYFQNTFGPAFASGWNSFWGGIASGWSSFWGTIGGFFVTESQKFVEGWNSFWGTVKTGADTVIAGVLDGWHNFWVGLLDGLGLNGEQIVLGWQTQWNQMWLDFTTKLGEIQLAWDTFWIYVGTKLQEGGQVIIDAWNLFWDTFKLKVDEIWLAITAAWTLFWDSIVLPLQAKTGEITAAWNAFWDGFWAKATEIWNSIVAGWNGFWGQFSGAQQSGQGASTQSWAEWARSLGEGIGNFIRETINAWVGFWGGIRTNQDGSQSAVQGSWNAFWGGLLGWAQGAWAGIVAGWNGMLQNLLSIALGILGQIQAAFDSAVAGIRGAVNSIIGAANSALGAIGGPQIPRLKTGGILSANNVQQLASGGIFQRIGSGFRTMGPAAIVGEGNSRYPEYVIPTDPSYRSRATKLFEALGSDLQMFDVGGILSGRGGRQDNSDILRKLDQLIAAVERAGDRPIILPSSSNGSSSNGTDRDTQLQLRLQRR